MQLWWLEQFRGSIIVNNHSIFPLFLSKSKKTWKLSLDIREEGSTIIHTIAPLLGDNSTVSSRRIEIQRSLSALIPITSGSCRHLLKLFEWITVYRIYARDFFTVRVLMRPKGRINEKMFIPAMKWILWTKYTRSCVAIVREESYLAKVWEKLFLSAYFFPFFIVFINNPYIWIHYIHFYIYWIKNFFLKFYFLCFFL